jgi:hypothetical protein
MLLHSSRWLTALIFPVLFAASGCRTERGKPDEPAHRNPKAAGAAGPVTDAEARTLSTQLCDVLHGLPARRKAECCGGSPQRILVDQCVDLVSRSLASHSVELRADALASCSKDMAKSLTGCNWVTPSSPLSPPSCQALFVGQIQAGGACRSSLECAGSLHCAGTTPSKAGICSEPAGVGAGCGAHIDALAAATLIRDLERSHPFCANFCDLASHKCEPLPKPGTPCVASVNCGPSQSCVEGACSAAPRAERAALAAPGGACESDFDCAAGGCLPSSNGGGACGPKCSLSFAQLKNASSPGMRLPLRARNE